MNFRMFRNALLIALAMLAIASPAHAETPLVTEARVIVKYKADSTLMRALSAQRPAPTPQHAAALSARLSVPLFRVI